MNFIEAAKKRDDNVWCQIMEICRGAARRFIKMDDEAIEEIVSMGTTKLMEQIDTYEPERGRGNIEANFIQWINQTVRLEVTHWREKKRKEDMFISIEDLSWTFGYNEEDDLDPSEIGENFLSHIVYKKDGRKNNPEFQLALKEVIDIIAGFGDVRLQKANIHHYIYGRTIEEIAVILGENESTVNNWIHRSKGAIRGRLRERGIDTTYLDRDSW